MQRDFAVFVEGDKLRVKFVARRTLGRLGSGHQAGGDYAEKLIRLPRYEARRCQRTTFFHELGHYLTEREEIAPTKPGGFLVRGTTEEEVCDLFTWIPLILSDPRNDALRAFLGVRL